MELSVSSETTFFNMKLQLEICPQLRTGSSAEDRGRIDTSGNPTKFWGLLVMVAPTAHIRRQKFLIGSFPQIEFFLWSRQCCQYLCPYMISPYKSFTTHALYTYIYVMHLTFLWKNLEAYNIQDSV